MLLADIDVPSTFLTGSPNSTLGSRYSLSLVPGGLLCRGQPPSRPLCTFLGTQPGYCLMMHLLKDISDPSLVKFAKVSVRQ